MALSDTKIESLKPKPKKYKVSDAKGLLIQVMPSGGKLWKLAYRFDGKQRELSLGAYPEISLKEAREMCFDARKLLAHGVGPVKEKSPQESQAAGCSQ